MDGPLADNDILGRLAMQTLKRIRQLAPRIVCPIAFRW